MGLSKEPFAELRIRGDFFSTHSFARVNRELSRALLRRRDVQIVPLAEAAPAAFAALGLEARRNENRQAHPNTFTLRHGWPPRFMRPAHGRYVHMQTTEYGALPREWIDDALTACDDVWCISSYMRSLYLEAGVPAERLAMIPHGIRSDVFRPEGPSLDVDLGDGFVFLFVGAALYRKGLDVLTAAFRAEFGESEPVVLLVKESAVGLDDVDGLRERTLRLSLENGARIVYTRDDVEDETMAALYRRADALVHPYRGEGFALPVLEAMACGTPVIVTGGGATDDFATSDLAYRIASSRVPSDGPGDLDLRGRGWLLEPDVRHLRRLMREVYTQRDRAHRRARYAAQVIRAQWTWDDAARIVVNRLRVLTEQGESRSRARSAPPERLDAYAGSAGSPAGEDGMLHELFARLGIDTPCFAEFNLSHTRQSLGVYCARVLGWKGVIVPSTAGASEAMHAMLREFPQVDIRPPGIAAPTFEPRELDLLIVHEARNDLGALIERFRPRVVCLPVHASVDAASAGYHRLAGSPAGTLEICLRRDLVALGAVAKASIAVG